jgi:hypothetical protein
VTNRIWTDARRQMLFEELVERFGPYSQWEKGCKPGRGLDPAFDEFVATFAKLVGSGPLGVEMQIEIAGGPCGSNKFYREAHNRKTHHEVAFFALRAGFIAAEQLSVPVAHKWRFPETETLAR